MLSYVMLSMDLYDFIFALDLCEPALSRLDIDPRCLMLDVTNGILYFI